MSEKHTTRYKISRSKVANGLLIIEFISFIILFSLLLMTVRARYSDLAIDKVSDKIVVKLSSNIWRSVVLIAQNGDELLSRKVRGNLGGYLVSPVSFSPDADFFKYNRKPFLTSGDKFNIYIGDPQSSLEHGIILPFKVADLQNRDKEAFGVVKVLGIFEYLNGLAGRDVFCKIFNLADNTVLANTEMLPGELRLKKMISDYGTLKSTIPEFNLGIEITAHHNYLEIPIIPQVLIILCFILFSSVIFFIHVRIIKPASMSVDLFMEQREEVGLDLPAGINSENLYLNVDSLITDHVRLKDSYLEVKDKLEEIESVNLKKLRKNHEELIIHHSITKKMLKALNKQSVFPLLLEGVAELGFKNNLWGVFHRENMSIDFNLDPVQYGKGKVTIPLLDDTYFLSKICWNGIYEFIEDASGIECRYDDQLLISNGPTFVIPVLKNRRFRCYQYFKCSTTDCPAYMSSDQRCWVRGVGRCDNHTVELTNNIKETCFKCSLYNVEGVLIVKGEKEGRELGPDSIGSITGLVNEASLALEIAELYEETERMSISDSLTGLYNHREFFKLLGGELDRAKRFKTDLSLLMIDVDNFKVFNDTYGHLAGDRALKMIAGAITKAVRKIDIVSRYGGEEFTVILPETNQGGSIVLAERIKSEVASINISPVDDELVSITVSIGICTYTGEDMTTDQIVSRADDAAYIAKKTGKNKICISDRI